jgi:serine/threonine protein kinase
MSGQYKAAKWISAEVGELIRKILEVNPERRFTISDIRRHPWYIQIEEDVVPKDIVTSRDAELAQAEAMTGMKASGFDEQAVLDGLASKTSNSMTATYYLLEQKAKRQLAKQKDPNSIAQSFSNRSVAGISTQKSFSNRSAGSRGSGSAASDSSGGRPVRAALPVIAKKSAAATANASKSTSAKPGVVPSLNLQSAVASSIKMSSEHLASQSARPALDAQSTVNIVQQGSKSARDAPSHDLQLNTVALGALSIQDNTSGAVPTANISNDVDPAAPPSGNVEPIITFGAPDLDADRPSTRRSRMRSRNGTNLEGEEDTGEANMYAPAGFEESDNMLNVPIVITTDGANMLPAPTKESVKFPPSQSAAKGHSSAQSSAAKPSGGHKPSAPKPSAMSGGRRGKNIAHSNLGATF